MHIDIHNKEDDIEELFAFCHRMIEASYFPAYCREAIAMFHAYHGREQMLSDAASGRVWCAREDGGRLAGTVTVAGGELGRMFVSPDMRGRGLGRELIEMALSYAGETGLNRLTAWSVPFSKGFYERFGFVMLNADTLNFEGNRIVPVPYIEMLKWPGGSPGIIITEAGVQDAGELIDGQKEAFVEQCSLYDDWRIPPMTEKPEDVAGFISNGGTVLKAVSQGRIIGAVRGKVEEGVCHVGRLYVLPEWQGRGAARRLIAALEEKISDCFVFSIFTGERSEKNIALYMKQGYTLTGRRAPAKAPGSVGNYDLVWLEKPNPWPEITSCARRFRSQ